MDNTIEKFHTIRGYQQKNHKELTPAMEDYLEMLYRLCLRDGCTRTGRLSEKLQVKPSSASKMIHKLREFGYIEMDSNGSILMSPKGGEIAEYLLYRHNVLDEFLKFLGHEETIEEVELLEHSVSLHTVEGLHKLMRFVNETKEVYTLWKHLQ